MARIDLAHLATVVLGGQVLSLLIAASNLVNTKLWQITAADPDTGFTLSFTQLALHYMFLLVVFIAVHVVRAAQGHSLRTDLVDAFLKTWKVYLPLGLFDFYANYCVTKAFGFTSSLSAFLLNSSSTPFTVIISVLLFKAKYKPLHYFAILVSVAGMGIVCWQDVTATSRLGGDAADGSNVVVGNILGLVSGLLFAAANTTQEYSVKVLGGPREYCLMMGLFGSVVSILHMALFERSEITALTHAPADQVGPIAACLAGFVAAMFLLYTLASLYFTTASATLFNLSILTSNFYVLVGTVLVLHSARVTAWYLVGFVLIVAGLVVFNGDPNGWSDMFTRAQAAVRDVEGGDAAARTSADGLLEGNASSAAGAGDGYGATTNGDAEGKTKA
ncbi:hypothetical protein GGF32_005142 [Allomyces javanicus]|nr:hypothetical protein GGF32_005142 [Allomyces javanicus]